MHQLQLQLQMVPSIKKVYHRRNDRTLLNCLEIEIVATNSLHEQTWHFILFRCLEIVRSDSPLREDFEINSRVPTSAAAGATAPCHRHCRFLWYLRTGMENSSSQTGLREYLMIFVFCRNRNFSDHSCPVDKYLETPKKEPQKCRQAGGQAGRKEAKQSVLREP